MPGDDETSGDYWIGRYSADFTEKSISNLTGLYYGPARGELCADGTLWAAWENGRGVHKFNTPQIGSVNYLNFTTQLADLTNRSPINFAERNVWAAPSQVHPGLEFDKP